ncbi:retrotransposon protein [Cucumis melo var. makuwa]|uniref:Retrotransposon protein n=1 Tax=Cucumis melo var. makuwa TaxID=1194695 RepID=A0A5D3DXB2_CUCMM|nr:retrotransposon protein [Cucumis melo var. makuwa]TYK28152.1 retrotransposon protein [Cucumis melo var. makuwa]
MASSSRAPKHVGTKEEEDTLVECLVELAIAEVGRPSCSEFKWKDEAKCIITEKELFDNWVKFELLMFFMQSHPAAKGLLNKLFSYYDELAYVFRRDRATGQFAETFVDIESNELAGYEGFDMSDENDMEFPFMYSQRIVMSQDDVRASRPYSVSDSRTGSSGSKRKRESQWEGEIEMIHMALECANDQLRTIVEWSARALANDTTVH